jgi:hypothetical protein
MNAKVVMTSLAAAALFASAAPRSATAAGDPPAAAVSDAAAPALGAMPSFAGTWVLDRSKSTVPQIPDGRGGMRGGMRAGGPDGARGGGLRGGGVPPGGAEGPRARAGARFASRIRITQVGGVLTVADSAGVAIQEIVYEDPAPPSQGIRRFGGEWTGSALVAIGEGPRGGLVTEEYALADHGATLEVRTRIEPEGGREALTFVRVYRRVEAK